MSLVLGAIAPAARTGDQAGLAPVVLAAHGSRDPRSAQTMWAVADAVGAEVGFLDFNSPSVPAALRAAAAAGVRPVVVPALLTRAYHGRVDLPEVVRSTGLDPVLTPVLGPSGCGDEPHPLLVAALAQRAGEAIESSEVDIDGLVLIAAGTSHPDARSTVENVAVVLGKHFNVACRVGYASASAPTGGGAVAALREAGATRIAAASYFLAAGRLYDAAAASARAAGVLAVAAPLGTADGLVDLVRERIRQA